MGQDKPALSRLRETAQHIDPHAGDPSRNSISYQNLFSGSQAAAHGPEGSQLLRRERRAPVIGRPKRVWEEYVHQSHLRPPAADVRTDLVTWKTSHRTHHGRRDRVPGADPSRVANSPSECPSPH